jgi:hypothetical protein
MLSLEEVVQRSYAPLSTPMTSCPQQPQANHYSGLTNTQVTVHMISAARAFGHRRPLRILLVRGILHRVAVPNP